MDQKFAPTIPPKPPQESCTPSTQISVHVEASPGGQVPINTRVFLAGIAQRVKRTRDCQLIEEDLKPFITMSSSQTKHRSSNHGEQFHRHSVPKTALWQ